MKLHLGCGARVIEGWINVDLSDFPHVHHKKSIENLDMFGNNSVDIIYSSHTIEYFDRVQINNVLTEWRRVLKPNGTLRLAVPNFDALIQVYLNTGDLNTILGPLYGKMSVLGAENETIYHRTVYNFESLKSTLENNGFSNVREFNWRDTEHSHIDDHSQAYYPHMKKEDGILVSLNVEAEKHE